jgi:Family of unknown function (DUF6529)
MPRQAAGIRRPRIVSSAVPLSPKVLLVQSRRLPGWVLPVAEGVLVVVVGVLWYTSALWYYNGFQLPAL